MLTENLGPLLIERVNLLDWGCRLLNTMNGQLVRP